MNSLIVIIPVVVFILYLIIERLLSKKPHFVLYKLLIYFFLAGFIFQWLISNTFNVYGLLAFFIGIGGCGYQLFKYKNKYRVS